MHGNGNTVAPATNGDVNKFTVSNPWRDRILRGEICSVMSCKFFVSNEVAMMVKMAGIDAKTQEVPGGVIVRDASGNPTGVFKDAAMALIYKAIPPITHEQRLRAARGALKHAASLGVTSVQHMNPEFADVATYSELAEKGELTTRIYAVPMETDWRDQAKSFSGVVSESFAPDAAGSVGNEPVRVAAIGVSRQFFRIIGVRLAVGREFNKAENHAGRSGCCRRVSRILADPHGWPTPARHDSLG